MSVLVPAALVTSSSFSSGSVSIVLAVYVEISKDLSAGSTVYSSSLEEIIGRLVIYSVESSSYYTTHQNPSKLEEGIPYSWEHYYLVDLKPSVYVVLPL